MFAKKVARHCPQELFPDEAVPAAQHYYFPQGMNPQKTQEIQSLESSLLLVKKILYVAELQEIERKRNPTFQGQPFEQCHFFTAWFLFLQRPDLHTRQESRSAVRRGHFPAPREGPS